VALLLQIFRPSVEAAMAVHAFVRLRFELLSHLRKGGTCPSCNDINSQVRKLRVKDIYSRKEFIKKRIRKNKMGKNV